MSNMACRRWSRACNCASIPATEISIYRSIPHTSPRPARQLQVPLAMVRGDRSNVIRRHHTLAVRGMPKAEYHSVPGGHMFPWSAPPTPPA
nr:hypothetical protein [Pseudomonas peli]